MLWSLKSSKTGHLEYIPEIHSTHPGSLMHYLGLGHPHKMFRFPLPFLSLGTRLSLDVWLLSQPGNFSLIIRMRKAKKSIVSPRLKFCNETISFQNVESLKKEVTYIVNLQSDLSFLILIFFYFHKSWVGRAMGNETFYGHGLIGISGLNLRCLTHHNIHQTYQIYPMIAISSLLL